MFWSNWRLLVGLYIVLAGTWGFLAKLSARHLTSWQLVFLTATTASIVMAATSARRLGSLKSPWAIVAVAAGILAAIGSVLFYRALTLAPANVVIPSSSLYIVVTAILSVMFLKEPLTVPHLLGILLALLAIPLLTKG